MLARYWGKVGSDDEYNAIRAKYGDSTSAEAQLSALNSLGGGHWSVVIGFTEAVSIHNDSNGDGQHYSWKNWQLRWEADGKGTGWLPESAASDLLLAVLSARYAPARLSSCREALIPPSTCCWRCWGERPFQG